MAHNPSVQEQILALCENVCGLQNPTVDGIEYEALLETLRDIRRCRNELVRYFASIIPEVVCIQNAIDANVLDKNHAAVEVLKLRRIKALYSNTAIRKTLDFFAGEEEPIQKAIAYRRRLDSQAITSVSEKD